MSNKMIDMYVVYWQGVSSVSCNQNVTIRQLFATLSGELPLDKDARWMAVIHPAEDYYENGRSLLFVYDMHNQDGMTVEWMPLKKGSRVQFVTDLDDLIVYKTQVKWFIDKELRRLAVRVANLANELTYGDVANGTVSISVNTDKLEAMKELIDLYQAATDDLAALEEQFGELLAGRRSSV
jgi:hypothetical protein